MDLFCRVDHCEKCVEHPMTCEQCSNGFWLDKDKNECVDSTCLVSNCEDCSISGPQKCDKCETGFFSLDESTCKDCDSSQSEIICEECQNADFCDKCATGYRNEFG